MKAVTLLSGGLDSTTVTAMAVRRHGASNVLALSVDYGQRHQRELSSAKQIAERLKIHHRILHLPSHLFRGADSTLINPTLETPHKTYRQLELDLGVSPTYVPFRNAILISMASAIALIEEAEEVWIGTHAEDARNWAYPDCTPEFNGAMSNAIYVGTYMKVRLVTPLQWMMKKDVVRQAYKVDTPVELTWSCYEGGTVACGKCPTCCERLAAFNAVGYVDPIPYIDREFWKQAYPRSRVASSFLASLDFSLKAIIIA